MAMSPLYHDPYDFSDDSTDEESYMEEDEGEELEDVDMELAGSDAGSTSSQGDLDSGMSTQSTASLSYPTTAPSVPSSYTSYDQDWQVEDDEDEGMSSDSSSDTLTYRREYGRGLNRLCDGYQLPADEEERRRLRRQHLMFIEIMQAKYPPEMQRVLQSTIPGEKRVLDLGCGNGDWIRDVARDFPLSECLAIDLAPIKYTQTLPPNVRFEVDDVNLGLQHCYGKFDVVHCRLISSGVRDYQLLIEHISRILRPGGLVELVEFDFHIYGRDQKRLNISVDDPLGPPYWARYMAYLHRGVKKNHGDVDAASWLWRWVTGHSAFDNITYRDVWIPSVPGNDDRYSEKVYPMMRQNITAFLRSGEPMLRSSGVSEEEVEALKEHSLHELHHSDEPQYTRLQCITALKRMDYVA